mmetsp:Transcript_13882/g.27984  ORF Transcript_13882/g.27984 Transcript_13882/m.27984 type:complete len:369 (+) Transcript_13882:60-1166(+)
MKTFDGISVPLSPSLKKTTTPLPSRRGRLPRLSSVPTIFFVAAIVLLFLVAYNTNSSIEEAMDEADGAAIFLRDEDDLFDLFESLNATYRCRDEDDPPEWFDYYDKHDHPCLCTDPTVPREREGSTNKRWKDWHNAMVKRAEKVQKEGLDFVLLGDSITEHWRGTKALGKVDLPKERQVFENYFRKSNGGTLDGEAFGTGGDTTTELLWHVTHKLLPKNVQPRAFVILIGTNDLDLQLCSKKHVLAGILNIATHVRKERPDSTIILHGITPRSEFYKDGEFHLGPRWEQIKWINKHLKQYAALQNDWFYIENSDMFLREDDPTMIDKTLMNDALHPTVAGYEKWSPHLANQITEILAMKKHRRKRLKQ